MALWCLGSHLHQKCLGLWGGPLPWSGPNGRSVWPRHNRHPAGAKQGSTANTAIRGGTPRRPAARLPGSGRCVPPTSGPQTHRAEGWGGKLDLLRTQRVWGSAKRRGGAGRSSETLSPPRRWGMGMDGWRMGGREPSKWMWWAMFWGRVGRSDPPLVMRASCMAPTQRPGRGRTTHRPSRTTRSTRRGVAPAASCVLPGRGGVGWEPVWRTSTLLEARRPEIIIKLPVQLYAIGELHPGTHLTLRAFHCSIPMI